MNSTTFSDFSLNESHKREIECELNLGKIDIKWLAGDGSDRRYFRINLLDDPNKTFVLMVLGNADALALKKNQYDWIEIGKLLTDQTICVPQTLRILKEFPAIIIEDYGNTMLETRVNELLKEKNFSSIKDLYHDCFGIVSKMLKITTNEFSSKYIWSTRSFDVEKLTWELNFFLEKYVFNVSNLTIDKNEMAQCKIEIKKISEFLAPYSKYFVHRDLHSRNLMCAQRCLALIDFQDARLGPASYDLISLIFDSYVPFNASFRNELLEIALITLRDNGLKELCTEIEATWKPMLLQRQLKAIGSFGYLTIDKKKGDYLKYVCPALKTLENQNIADERWPFLSSVLLRKIRDFISK